MNKIIFMALFQGAGTSGLSAIETTSSGGPAGQQADFALLLLAVSLVVVGLFLIHQASSVQAWLIGTRSSGFSSNAGMLLSWLWALSVITLWSVRYLRLFTVIDLVPPEYRPDFVIRELWINPREFVGGVLIAGLVPNLIALSKNLSVLASWSTLFASDEVTNNPLPENSTLFSWQLKPKDQAQVQPPLQRTLRAPTKSFSIANAGLSVLAISSNIATLVEFFFHPGKK